MAATCVPLVYVRMMTIRLGSVCHRDNHLHFSITPLIGFLALKMPPQNIPEEHKFSLMSPFSVRRTWYFLWQLLDCICCHPILGEKRQQHMSGTDRDRAGQSF